MKGKTAFGALAGLCLAALLLIVVPFASARVPNPAPQKAKTTKVQLLAINDFHGNLEPPAGSSGRIGAINAGGVEYLSTHLKTLEATNSNTLIVSAGDLIGASPLLSGLFHDEPSIEAANIFGLDFNAVGNHEFDEGAVELSRMQHGGCHPHDGCQDGDGFDGAEFDFLAANVKWHETGETLFPAYKIVEYNGAKIGLIGMTLEGTPTIVSPSGVAGLDFLDEADTVNALIPELRAEGVRTVVVLIHEGGFPTGGFNECPGISGPIVDIVNRTSDEVDLFITGHTHQAYNCVIDGRPVTSAASFGRLITDYDLTISRATKQPIEIRVDNKIVTRDVAKDPLETELILKYKAFADPIANRVIGSITADITRTQNAAGESALGDVIADAQLEATDDATTGEAVAAFMNPGGIRADLTYASSSVGEGDGNVTYGEAFTVQPFGNSLVTLTLSGAQIHDALEQQWCGVNLNARRILQPSVGFTYSFDGSSFDAAGKNLTADCDRINPADIKIGGVTVNPAASYRITVNSFLADGGDGFSVLAQGTDRLGGEVDTDALEKYFQAHSPVPPGPRDRISTY
jgi:5'-nucleotidase